MLLCGVDLTTCQERGIDHQCVSKQQFVESFASRCPKVSHRFIARRHKLSPVWANIMNRRDWKSTTPESSRVGYAVWNWIRHWHSLSPASRPSIGASWLSALLPHQHIIVGPDQIPKFCLGVAKYGAVVCKLVALASFADDAASEQRQLWKLSSDVSWAYVTNLDEWRVVPHVACSPLSSKLLCPGQFVNCVCLREIAAPVSLLRFAFSQKVSLSFAELKELAIHLKLNLRGCNSRAKLIVLIVEHVCGGSGDASAVAAHVLAADVTPSKQFKVDPLTEAAFDQLDAEEQKEFPEFKKKIERSRQERKIAGWRAARAKAKAKAIPKRTPKKRNRSPQGDSGRKPKRRRFMRGRAVPGHHHIKHPTLSLGG